MLRIGDASRIGCTYWETFLVIILGSLKLGTSTKYESIYVHFFYHELNCRKHDDQATVLLSQTYPK